MPSTYSTSLRLELIGNGEQAGNWGNTNNINLGTLLEQAIAGVESVAISGTSYTLTTGNGVSDQARNAVIVLTGTLPANCNVIVPSVDKTYTFRNATTGGFSVVVKTAAGSGVTIANGYTQAVYCDATNVVASGAAFNNAANSVAGNLVGSVSANAGSAAAPSITFTGDPDTGIYNAGPNQFAIATGGTVRFLVDASSYVGVNTIAPARQLEVASTNNHMRFSTPGDATAYYDFGRDNADGLFFFNGAQPTFVGYKWQINGTERLRLSATGQLLASSGTAAAPAFTFGDADSGIFGVGSAIGFSHDGVQRFLMQSNAVRISHAGNTLLFLDMPGASASVSATAQMIAANENGWGVTVINSTLNTDGSADLQLLTTPPGARTAGRAVLRATIPGSGAISLVGPVNVTSGGQTVTGDLEASGNLRFNSGYGSAAIAYGVRAWVNFNGTGTVAIRASGGVTSITDNGTGDYTVNFNFTMPDANYAPVVNVAESGVAGGSATEAASHITLSTTSYRFACKYSYSIFSAAAASFRFDPSTVSVMIAR